MIKASKVPITITVIMLMAILMTTPCYANSAEPPSILIIVSNPPDDLEISIGSDNTYMKANKTDKVIEKYYTFYSSEFRIANDYTLQITRNDSAFQIPLKKPVEAYNNIYTLDLEHQKLIPGKSIARSILLVSIRLTLTLLIEAIVFWLFGFKYKKSWYAFLAINLITQGGLNMWLNGFAPLGSYLILTLILGETLVFVVETIAFLTFIQEYSRMRRLLYVIVANLLSLFAGGYIITLLPI